LETLKGKVTHIVFKNDDTGFKVLKIKMPKGPSVSITGEFGPDIIKGTEATFHGDYKAHPKYGNSFRVSSYAITHNQEQVESLQIFLDHSSFNIGTERAHSIVSHFGEDLISILDDAPHRLLEVDGIGEVSAQNIQDAWKEKRQEWFSNREQYDLRAFLNNLGIKERRVKKILTHFGKIGAEEVIRSNPYVLTEIDGFGFSTADFIARQLGVPESDPMRLKAYIHYLLKILCPGNGHLYLTVEDIVAHINKYCEEAPTTFVGKNILIPEDVTDPIKVLQSEKFIEDDNGAIYAKQCYLYETASVSRLLRIMTQPSDLMFLKMEDVEKHILSHEKDNDITLSEEQKMALYQFAKEKVSIITGLPGTGKTTIIRAIVSLIKKQHLRLTCMTPTGISAKRMAETTGHDAYTIHRILGYRGNEWTYNEGNKFDTDVIIIDEASMVDQEVFYRLLSAIKDRVHLIIVGDHNQLPSVGAGNVLRELLNCEMIPTVKLEKIFRQNEASSIIKVSHQIKDGNPSLELFKDDPKGDVFFYRENSPEKIEGFIVKLCQKFKEEKKVIFQILSPRNQGPLSVESLNTILQEVLNPAKDDLSDLKCLGFILRKGDRIKVKKNDYENGIYNGDIGKVSHIGGGFVTIIVDERPIKLSVDEVNEKIKLAYCLSVHASQGQEYPYILLPFINQHGKMLLQRNLLYTAITRAKQKVIIMGHGSAIEKAINNSSVYRRNTKLGERIIACFQSPKKSFLPELHEAQKSFQNAKRNKEPFSFEAIESVVSDTIDESCPF